MKTFTLISALAAVALAAPYYGEDQFNSDTNQEYLLKINEREKKSPIAPHMTFLGHHSGPQILDKKHFLINKPIIFKKKLGHQLLRSDDEEQSESQEKCAKKIKVKLCDIENLSKAKESMKGTTIEDMNVHLVGDDMEQSIKMAKEAVENLQRDLHNMEKSSNDEAHRANWKSADFHEDIEIARQALEHVQNNFGNLESFSLVAPTTEDLMKEASQIPLTKEDERLASWHTAMKNIQKDVEVVRNIKDSSKSASEPQIMNVMVGSETDNKISKEIMPLHHNNEIKDQLRTSNNDKSINEKSELALNTKEEEKGSKDVVALLNAKNDENVNKENDMKTSATETKDSLVRSENTLKETGIAKLDKETMDKMTELELVDHLLKLTDKRDKPNTNSNDRNKWAEPKLSEKEQMTKVELKKINEDIGELKSVKSEEELKPNASNILNSDAIQKSKELEGQTQKKEETIMSQKLDSELKSIKQESKLSANPLNEKTSLETETKTESLKGDEHMMHLDEASKIKTISQESSIVKSAQNVEQFKNDNTVAKSKDMANDNILKSAVVAENLSQSNKQNIVENSADAGKEDIIDSHHHHHHHNHHHNEIIKEDIQKAATVEKSEKMIEQVKVLDNKKSLEPVANDMNSALKSASIDATVVKTNEELKEVKDDSPLKVNHVNPETEAFKAASFPKLQEENQSQKHMAMGKSVDSESEMMPSQQHHHHQGVMHQKSTLQQQHEHPQFHQRNDMSADQHRMMKSDSPLAPSFNAMDRARTTHFSGHSHMAERGSHTGRMNMRQHGMDSAMQPSMHMNTIMDPMSKSAMEYNTMQWKHGGKSSSYGAPEATSGSGGAVGVFPNANVGNCGIPLLLSCNPSVVTGSLAKPHYSAPSYRADDSFSYLKKRDVKVNSLDKQGAAKPRTSTIFKNTSMKDKTFQTKSL